VRAWIPLEQGVPLLGTLPDGVEVDVWDGTDEPPASIGEVEFWVPPFLGNAQEPGLLAKMTSLRVVQLLSAGADAWVGRLPAGVSLHDARGVHTTSTSEWVVGAILSVYRSFPEFARAQAERRWAYRATDELAGKRILIVGAGDIGEAIRRRLEPFEVEVVRVARRARPGVHAVAELPALLPAADAVVVVVPLTEATRGMVDADFLARMKDGALLVNAARGPVADTAALTAELSSGRLLAAVDVTDPEPLPADHPLWTAPGLALLTPHVGGSVYGAFRRGFRLAGEQLRRYAAGEPLVNEVADGY
jgi:phosphoglycerate dehydrogenase-like enzyme